MTKGLSVKGAALSYVSTLIGAGIIALPYAFVQAGPFLAVFLHLFMASCLMMAVILYFKTKDNLGYESLAELAYLCLGRASVFIIYSVFSMAVFSIVVMYTILFSKIGVSIYESYLSYVGRVPSSDSTMDNVLLSKITYCLVLYFFNLPFIANKSIKELKIISYILFAGIVLINAVFLLKIYQGEKA